MGKAVESRIPVKSFTLNGWLYEIRLAADGLRAVRAAFWVGMRLMSLGQTARASGWLARPSGPTRGSSVSAWERNLNYRSG